MSVRHPRREGFDAIPRPVEATATIGCCVRRPYCLERIVATVATGRDWSDPDLPVGFDATARAGGKAALAAAIRTATSSGWVILDVRGEPVAYCPEHADRGMADARAQRLSMWNAKRSK